MLGRLLKSCARVAGFGLACLVILGIFALILGLSWFVTCALVYLVCLCFSWTFDILIATGIWIILIILGMLFN